MVKKERIRKIMLPRKIHHVKYAKNTVTFTYTELTFHYTQLRVTLPTMTPF